MRIVYTGTPERKEEIIIEFRRLGEHTIKCLISEEEVSAMGFSMEEIITNGARTQEFMNHIFDMAEEEFDTKFNLGFKTVQMEYRSDRTLSLTFSDHPADEVIGRLRELIGGMLGSLGPEKLKELEDLAGKEEDEDAEGSAGELIFALKFPDIDRAIRFAKQLPFDLLPISELIRYQDSLYLLIDSMGCPKNEIRALALRADEYDVDVEFGRGRLVLILEHGTTILGADALEHLRQL